MLGRASPGGAAAEAPTDGEGERSGPTRHHRTEADYRGADSPRLPTAKSRAPRNAGAGGEGREGSEGRAARLARPAGRATRKKGGPPYGPREHTAQRGGPPSGGTLARVSAAHGERGQTARCAKQGAPPALTKPRARPGFPCGMSPPRE